MKWIHITVFALSLFCFEMHAQSCFSGTDFLRVNAGATTYGLVSEDFNNDGRADLACSNDAGNAIKVLINNNNLGFFAPVSYPAGTQTQKLIAAHLNADVFIDMVAVNYGSSSVSVFINSGSGTFAPTVNYTVGLNPTSVTATDLTGDSIADLVCTCLGGSAVRVLLNSGSGTFSVQAPFSLAAQPYSITSGRFNNDLFNDIVVACNNSYLYIKYGNGIGGFLPGIPSMFIPSVQRDLITFDANDDGIDDVAGVATTDLYIFTNNGNAVFSITTCPGCAWAVQGMDYGDLDGDSLPDIACSMGSVAIAKNQGNSIFTKVTDFTVNTYASSIVYGTAIADFNGDGRNDVAATSNTQGYIWIFYNGGEPLYNVVKPVPVTSGLSGIAITDFDGDGVNDIIATGATATPAVTLFRGLGNLEYDTAVSRSIPTGASTPVVDDFNQDGWPDVAFISNNVSVIMNNGSGGFLAPTNYSVGGANDIASGDFNNDQYPDIVLVRGNSIRVLMNNGNGTFALSIISTNSGYSVSTLDFNYDGNMDFVFGSLQRFYIALGNGNGTFVINNGPLNLNQPQTITAGDFNNDSLNDIITYNFVTDNYSFYAGTGPTSFLTPTVFGQSNNSFELPVCDYNQDGYLDFASADLNYTSITVFENNHSGGFIPHTSAAPSTVQNLAWGDANNDGIQDLFYSAISGTAISLMLNSTAIIQSVGPAVTCNNDSVILVATAGASTYLWSPGGDTTDTLVAYTSGVYSCTIMNASSSCSSTGSFTVTINAVAGPTASITPPNDSVCINQGNVALNGLPAGGIYSGPGVTGSVFDPQVSGAGTFPVEYVFTDTTGCTDTASVNVTVLPTPVMNLSLPGNDTACITSSPFSISGSPSGGIFSGPGMSGSTFDPSTAGAGSHVVSYSFANPFGCADTVSQVITVVTPTAISATASGPLTFCQSDSVVLTASPGFSTYLWSNASSQSSTTITQSGSYSVTATTIYGCTSTSSPVVVSVNALPIVNLTPSGPSAFCYGDSVTLLATSGLQSYAWNTGDFTDSLRVDSTGLYIVTATDINGCSDTATLQVTVYALPMIGVTGDTLLCSGDSTTLTANGCSFYTWSSGGTTASEIINTTVTASFSVTGTDVNGCTDSISVQVTVYGLPTISVNGDTLLCSGDTTVLTASGASLYSWSSGGTNASEIISPNVSTTIFVTGTDLNGCTDTNSVAITVYSLPVVGLDLSAVDTQCVSNGNTILLGGTPSNGNYGGLFVTGNVFDPSAAGTGTFAINYIFSDSNGCAASATDSIYVDVCAGINNDQNFSIELYPNPADAELNIIIPQPEEKITSFELTNQFGQVILFNDFSSQQDERSYTLNVTTLPEGVYYVTMHLSSGIQQSTKVVIVRN